MTLDYFNMTEDELWDEISRRYPDPIALFNNKELLRKIVENDDGLFEAYAEKSACASD